MIKKLRTYEKCVNCGERHVYTSTLIYCEDTNTVGCAKCLIDKKVQFYFDMAEKDTFWKKILRYLRLL